MFKSILFSLFFIMASVCYGDEDPLGPGKVLFKMNTWKVGSTRLTSNSSLIQYRDIREIVLYVEGKDGIFYESSSGDNLTIRMANGPTRGITRENVSDVPAFAKKLIPAFKSWEAKYRKKYPLK